MSALWNAMKRTLNCKPERSEVYEPKPRESRTRRRSRNSCCKPKLRDVIRDNTDQVISTRMREKRPANFSPLSMRSSDLINPVTNLFRLSTNQSASGNGSPYLASVSPGSKLAHYFNGGLESFGRANSASFSDWIPGSSSSSSRRISMAENNANGSSRAFASQKCGEKLTRKDAESHILSKHAVSEVFEGDSSRKIVEMIFKSGWTSFDNRAHIDKILKVHNPQTKLAEFEEYREMVKIRANRQQNSRKHPRCLADGNELLRFYGTTLTCFLGKNKSASLCTMENCNVCCILRHGFSGLTELTQDHSVFGIFTTSTSERAYRNIQIEGEESRNLNKALRRKALILCRVIAGRVHKPMVENSHELVSGRRSGFDSLAGKTGFNGSHIDELYVLNPIALLPCFVIVCK